MTNGQEILVEHNGDLRSAQAEADRLALEKDNSVYVWKYVGKFTPERKARWHD